jgi:hypothetical protein
MSEQTMVYLGRMPCCGKVESFQCVELLDPDSVKRAAQETRRWTRYGATLELVTLEEARQIKLARCTCKKADRR